MSVRTSNISQKVQETLVNKGLEQEAAFYKANKLFSSTKNLEDRLNRIENSSHLSISKEKLHDTLAKYVLHERNLDLNSFGGVLGFIQNISLNRLNEYQLNDVREIALAS